MTGSIGRRTIPPPHNPDAETAALAGVLNHPHVAGDVLVIAAPDSFYVPSVAVVADLVAEGLPPEPVTVAGRLNGSGYALADLVGLTVDAGSDSATPPGGPHRGRARRPPAAARRWP